MEPYDLNDFMKRKLRDINEGSPLRGELPGGVGMPVGGFRPTGALAGRAAPAGNPRFPTRPVQTPVTPRPAPRPGAFTPAQPGYTPGQFSARSSVPMTPRQDMPDYSAYKYLAGTPVAGGIGYGVYKAGEGLRERRGDEVAPAEAMDVDAVIRSLPQPQGPTRSPAEILESETRFPDVPMPQGPTRSPEDVIRETLERERAARMPARPSQPSGRAAPVEPAGNAMPQEPKREEGFLSRLFSGPQYQGTGGQLLQRSPEGRTTVNWGDRDSAADFFRADAAMRKLQADKQDFGGASGQDIEFTNRMAAAQQNAKGVPEGKAHGGEVGGNGKPTKEAMLHKALEIIHHLIQR